jgi:hypothetical protein
MLTSLGATSLADVAEGVELADPDSNELRGVGTRGSPASRAAARRNDRVVSRPGR